MCNEFAEQDVNFEGPFGSGQELTGEETLNKWEIEDVDPVSDMMVLAVCAVVMQMLALVVLCFPYNLQCIKRTHPASKE